MSIKKDTFRSTSFRENIILKTDTKDKANFCKRQVQSAFTVQQPLNFPQKRLVLFSMENITVDPKGIARMLGGLNVHKAPCQDGLNARVLKECSNEISHILALKPMSHSVALDYIRVVTHMHLMIFESIYL